MTNSKNIYNRIAEITDYLVKTTNPVGTEPSKSDLNYLAKCIGHRPSDMELSSFELSFAATVRSQ